jgi:hypothetical protein
MRGEASNTRRTRRATRPNGRDQRPKSRAFLSAPLAELGRDRAAPKCSTWTPSTCAFRAVEVFATRVSFLAAMRPFLRGGSWRGPRTHGREAMTE